MLRTFLISACTIVPVIANAQPQAVEATALGPREIRVFWNPVVGARRFEIIRDGAKIGEVDPTVTQFTDTTLDANSTYRYQVAATDGSGDRSFSRAYIERTFPELPTDVHCDLLVVGATSAGVAAAITASRYGMGVVLIEETRRLGGMPVNGLGATDIRRQEHSSGLFEEFRQKVRAIYGEGNGFAYEPRVAHQAMKELLWSCPLETIRDRGGNYQWIQRGLIVFRQVRPVRVRKAGAEITQVDAESVPDRKPIRFLPKLVIDATECGDVAAWAGAPFRLGREARSKREPHAGHLFYDRANDKALPGSTGKGDKRLQAYAYLMTVKDYGPGVDKTIPRPPGYDKSKYDHAPKWENSWAFTSGKLPNGKHEVNQHPHGSDLQGINYNYPIATYAERHRIEQAYRDHALGYLYYLQTEEGHKSLGLSEDDYRDSDGWPQLLYIREARRFESDVVLDEADIDRARNLIRPDSIGLGDYPMDSHAVQPKTDWSTPDMGEGEFYLPQYSPWHQAPYRVMIPKRVDNVFVPTAVSATHVAYGTLRLEPVRMHFGEAAAIAAYLCLRHNVKPREVPIRQIQDELLKNRQGDSNRPAQDGIAANGPSKYSAYLYFFPDVIPSNRLFTAIQWLAARGFWPSPPQQQHTISSGQQAAPFKPDEPCDMDDALHMFDALEDRRIDDIDWERKPTFSSGSRSWYRVKQRQWASGTLPTAFTREDAADMWARLLLERPPARNLHYADLKPGPLLDAAEMLYASGIDSRLWDDWNAYAPDGKLLFRPNEPMTRGQVAQLIYLLQVHFGPLWEDHVADRAMLTYP